MVTFVTYGMLVSNDLTINTMHSTYKDDDNIPVSLSNYKSIT